MNEHLEQWRRSLQAAGRSRHTVRAYVGGVRRAAGYHGVDAVDLTGQLVTEYLAAQSCQASRWQEHKSLRLWAAWLTEVGHPSGPLIMAGVTAPQQPDAEPRPISEDAYRAVMACDLSLDERAMLLLAAEMGLRVSEIARVHASDFDGPVLLVRGKGRAHRRADRVAVPAPIRVLPMPTEGYWFPSPVNIGGPVCDVQVWRVITRAMARAGVDATPHQLRHRYATHMVRSGVPLTTVSKMMRHRSVRTTQRYVLVDDSDMLAALRLIEGTD